MPANTAFRKKNIFGRRPQSKGVVSIMTLNTYNQTPLMYYIESGSTTALLQRAKARDDFAA
jgi:hypothetical protein